jgi:hypothetical protein
MHQVTPESIRKLREILKQHQYKYIESQIDTASDSEVIIMAVELFELQVNSPFNWCLR